MSEPVVRAAGGVVWRPVEGAAGVEVLVVHRPRYGDWTFPKGKLDDGESERDAALREVAEETGLTCRLGVELAATAYVDRRGRSKEVRYWAMVPEPGAVFRANDEVDRAEWLSPEEARRRLTYGRDGAVLDAFLAAPRG